MVVIAHASLRREGLENVQLRILDTRSQQQPSAADSSLALLNWGKVMCWLVPSGHRLPPIVGTSIFTSRISLSAAAAARCSGRAQQQMNTARGLFQSRARAISADLNISLAVAHTYTHRQNKRDVQVANNNDRDAPQHKNFNITHAHAHMEESRMLGPWATDGTQILSPSVYIRCQPGRPLPWIY